MRNELHLKQSGSLRYLCCWVFYEKVSPLGHQKQLYDQDSFWRALTYTVSLFAARCASVGRSISWPAAAGILWVWPETSTSGPQKKRCSWQIPQGVRMRIFPSERTAHATEAVTYDKLLRFTETSCLINRVYCQMGLSALILVSRSLHRCYIAAAQLIFGKSGVHQSMAASTSRWSSFILLLVSVLYLPLGESVPPFQASLAYFF